MLMLPQNGEILFLVGSYSPFIGIPEGDFPFWLSKTVFCFSTMCGQIGHSNVGSTSVGMKLCWKSARFSGVCLPWLLEGKFDIGVHSKHLNFCLQICLSDSSEDVQASADCDRSCHGSCRRWPPAFTAAAEWMWRTRWEWSWKSGAFL
jgi:hypothetical protein